MSKILIIPYSVNFRYCLEANKVGKGDRIQVDILNMDIRENLTDEVKFEQSPEDDEVRRFKSSLSSKTFSIIPFAPFPV